jgi:hypothetical protein
LTGRYGGHTLLLRKELLSEPEIFNAGDGYYPDSDIDTFLSDDYINCFPPRLRDEIIDSTIEITSQDSLGVCGKDTETIQRKVFLLSYTEVGLSGSSTASVEGKKLSYFSNADDRIATKNAVPGSWWLRTAYTWYTGAAWGIGADGGCGGGGAQEENGVRPAFCVRNDLPVSRGENQTYIIKGTNI